jgi:UDP-GlcNAc:undecaprenyl-phosphate GlcNAc-1-phosphate transferase
VLIATLTIRLHPSSNTSISSFLVPILLLAIPILDTTIAVLSRLRRGLSPFQGGQDHLSHRLIRIGLSRKQSAISLWSLSGFFGLLAVLISQPSNKFEHFFTAFASAIWLTLFYLFFRTKDS